MIKINPDDLANMDRILKKNEEFNRKSKSNKEKLDNIKEEDFDAILEGETAWEKQREEDAFQIHQGNWNKPKW